MSKKYFWLKQKADFFRNAKIKKLRRMAGGDTYTIIYQKFMLLSIANDGVISYQGIEPTLYEELALELDEDEVNVQATLVYLEAQGMIEQLSDTEYLMPQVIDLIGSESDSAERVRKLRAKKKQIILPKLTDGGEMLHCNEPVTKCNTELELNKEIELELNLKSDKNRDVPGSTKGLLCIGEDTFDIFWKAYPKKKSKELAKKAFYKHLKSMPDISIIVNHLESMIHTKDWQKENGRFIPHPAKWIESHGWEDEILKHNQSVRLPDGITIFDIIDEEF